MMGAMKFYLPFTSSKSRESEEVLVVNHRKSDSFKEIFDRKCDIFHGKKCIGTSSPFILFFY